MNFSSFTDVENYCCLLTFDALRNVLSGYVHGDSVFKWRYALLSLDVWKGGRVMHALRTELERLSDDTTDVKMLPFNHFSETDECQSSSTTCTLGTIHLFYLKKNRFHKH